MAMAGTIHEAESASLLAQIEQESAAAAKQLAEAAHLRKGQIVVVGCSTSEVVGRKVGSWSTPEVGQAVYQGLNSVFAPLGVYLAAQCCEHLNRAVIVDHDAVPGAEIVNVKPQPKAGGFWEGFLKAIDTSSVVYMIFYFLMIIAFSYFYATIQFNPIEISNNLKKNGGFIPGFRPGKPTSDFIRKVLNKVTLFGAVYLGIVAILPLIIGKIVNVSALSIGGTSVIIVVGVALETVQALESQMLMRQYKGFLE